jgi:hypothetical protein
MKETLEEAAAKHFNEEIFVEGVTIQYALQEAFIEGAKWQQERMYSEEEVTNIIEQTIEKFYKHFYTLTKSEMKEEWFKQFKKK